MTRIALCLLLITSGFSASRVSIVSEAAAQETQEGKVQFDTTIYSFGSVPEGQLVEKEFRFVNSGNADLKILKVASACGCTAAASSTEPIAAGLEGSVKVAFDSDGFSGPVKKVVRVHTTDRANPEVMLTIEGRVERSVEVSPSRISFSGAVSGKASNAEVLQVKIKKTSSKKIKSVYSYSKYLTVSPQAVQSEADFDVYPFSVELSPKAPEGVFRDRILVDLQDGAKSTSLNVSVWGQVDGQVAAEPKQLSFGIVSGQTLLERQIKVQIKGDRLIELTEVSSDIPAIEASLVPVEKGRNYIVKISLDPQNVKSDFRGLVKIETNDPAKPELLVSVFGVVPPRQNF